MTEPRVAGTTHRDLRAIRIECGLGLRQAARRLGVSSTHLADIEMDRRAPSDELIQGLAQEYGLSEAVLRARWRRPPADVARIATKDALAAEKVPAILRAAESIRTPEQWDALLRAAENVANRTDPAELDRIADAIGLFRWADLLAEIARDPERYPLELRIAISEAGIRASELLRKRPCVGEEEDHWREVASAYETLERTIQAAVELVANVRGQDTAKRATAAQPRGRLDTPRGSGDSVSHEDSSDDEPPPCEVLSLERCRALIPGADPVQVLRLRRAVIRVAAMLVEARTKEAS